MEAVMAEMKKGNAFKVDEVKCGGRMMVAGGAGSRGALKGCVGQSLLLGLGTILTTAKGDARARGAMAEGSRGAKGDARVRGAMAEGSRGAGGGACSETYSVA